MHDTIFTHTNRYQAGFLEDRCAPRHRLEIPAQLRVSGSKGFQTTVVDLSLAGFCAVACSRIYPGTTCWLTLPGLGALQAEAVWWESAQVGCAFGQLLSPVVFDPLIARWSKQSFILSNA